MPRRNRRAAAVVNSRTLPALSKLAERTLRNQHAATFRHVPASLSPTGRAIWRVSCACTCWEAAGARSIVEAGDAHDDHLADVLREARQRLADARAYDAHAEQLRTAGMVL